MLRRLLCFFISLCLIAPAFTAIGDANLTSFAASETEEKVFEDLISYDIWKHSNGKWQSTGSPGSSVSFKYSSSVNIDTSKKLVEVKVEYLQVDSNHKWYSMSLRSASISSVSYKNGSVSYKVSGSLNSNIAPLDIKQYSWQNANVEGYRYYIPIKITVVYEKIVIEPDEVVVPDESTSEETEEETPDKSEETGETEEPEQEEVKYDGDADLLMPSTGYVGHRILLQDCSTFTDGEKTYSAYSFYRNKLGRNSFKKEFGPANVSFYYLTSSSSGYYTDRYAVFPEPGDYSIKLTAKINNGYASVDTESISILPVPDVSAKISGVQKENRKQILNISVALNPQSKLKKVWVELSEKDGSNKVHLDYVPGDSANNKNNNSELIKTRALKTESSTEYFEKIYLEFLTKNDTQKSMIYTVYAEDESGITDTASGSFLVYPDEAPTAAIEADKYQLRNKGANVANISLKDVSLTYGDQIKRNWYVKEGNAWNENFTFEDNSFGSLKNIVHLKTGVGKAEYMLKVTDVIPESETLYEYISDSDLKSSVAYAESEVLNVAPTVSLKVEAASQAEILVIADKNNLLKAKESIEYMNLCLAEKGIDGDINLQVIEGNLSDKNGFDKGYLVETPFSYLSQWTSYESSNFIADSRKAYKIGAEFGSYGGGAYADEPSPKEPYLIQAYDLASGSLLWEKSFYDATFNLGTSFCVSQDNSEEYLYISANEKTLIVDKSEGTLMGTVNAVLKGSNFVNENYIYSFSEKGILRADKKNGAVKIIESTPVYGNSIMLKGKVNYAVNKDSVLKRGYFDISTEKSEYVNLDGTDGTYVGYDFDIYGNIATVKMSSGKIASVKVFNEQNVSVKEINLGGYYSDSVAVLKDLEGKFSYVGYADQMSKKRSSGTKYYTYVYANSIWDDKSLSTYTSTKSNYRTSENVVYGYSEGTNAYLITGAEYYYVLNQGTNVYTERAYLNTFNFASSSVSMTSTPKNIEGISSSEIEYGKISDESLILQSTEGNPTQDGIKGSKTMFARCLKDGKFILNKYYNKYMGKKEGSYKAVFIINDGNAFKYNEGGLSGSEFSQSVIRDKAFVYENNDSKAIKENTDAFINYISGKNSEASSRRIFKKGQTVSLKGIYSDYENDPSKASYYIYYHCPYNDGENTDVNYIINDNFNVLKTQKTEPLANPITKFYKDGMYKVVHWQTDNTGNTLYDKNSEKAEMIFYIQGTAAAPYITKIASDPAAPKEGKTLSLKIDYDDEDKETLTLNTKVYLDDKLIVDKTQSGLAPDSSGKYPTVEVPVTSAASNGKYYVICKISDPSYSSSDEYYFTIVSDYKVSGMVNHTSQWETNRKKYNKSLFMNECNYLSDYKAYALQNKPRKRGTNVFWSEEKFALKAVASGNPTKVVAQINGTTFSAQLSNSGGKDSSGNAIYTGELWNKSIKGKWGVLKPAEVKFTFTAYYDGGVTKKSEAQIIIDDTDSYWRVHKLY